MLQRTTIGADGERFRCLLLRFLRNLVFRMKSSQSSLIGSSSFTRMSLAVLVLFLVADVFLIIDAIRKLSSNSDYATLDQPSPPRRFLITGAAGFIGFHMVRRLSSNKNNLVVALDNFNDYYDVQQKIDRAFLLAELGVDVYKDDLCNDRLLHDLMTQYNFTHVIHLAAQAGVRYSLKDPLAYVTANYECFLVLLETLKLFPTTNLIYASSSSVYGKNSKVPFSHTSNTETPSNMYAATKKADELLGFLYCRLYNLTIVGLRLFTVYGPWGRPDMAIYMFAQQILSRKDVALYQDSKLVSRDFTYVDDIIDGIESAIDYRPVSCGETFNLGLGRPVSVLDMVRMIERELGLKAKIKPLKLPATEILHTWANISDSIKYLNFNPKISLENGIKEFILWHKDYTSRKFNSTWLQNQRNWFSRIEAERLNRTKKYENKRRGPWHV